MSEPLSGTQVRLTDGDAVVDVASVGASLRAFTVAGSDLVVPYGEDEVRPLYRGAALVPWPNRVVDGRYRFEGVDHQLALTEPDRGHALHGLAVWLDFAVEEAEATRAVLRGVVPAQAGYPFRIETTVTYELAGSALTTRIESVNTGDTRAPYGTSGHPYVVAGPGRVDDWTLEFNAITVLEVDDRLVPVGRSEIDGTEFDYRSPRRIGSAFLDHAFTDLVRDDQGIARVRLLADDGHGAEMVWGAGCGWVQIHTGDRPEPDWNRRGLAVEPMTCPPDAFNSGDDLVVLEPGDRHVAEWTLRAV
ncbi:aldose 1-epimerase family protein [Amnibacterium sp. CER49]|uniref:aldose 1-epimerase family protein n=1 Tax=Amnibacterium sp. CER49 TaxID=3039161 RepID=UPI002446A473|nr:aldose 1-epimerase family protein [Amnibacterium sp. CER49]MDH2445474.1 aldose 1-epimerase family protein [Amnibacterium sp. CER49]